MKALVFAALIAGCGGAEPAQSCRATAVGMREVVILDQTFEIRGDAEVTGVTYWDKTQHARMRGCTDDNAHSWYCCDYVDISRAKHPK